MAQAKQIVPTFSFPYVQVVINDYSEVLPDEEEITVDTAIKQAYAVVARKGKDNKFIRKNSRASAIDTFGDSDWNKYGQPLLQALDAAYVDNSSVYMMRVMPVNATYANAFVYFYYKADTEEDYPEAHKRRFRIKHTYNNFPDIQNAAALKAEFKKDAPEDPDFEGLTCMMLNVAGRGDYGQWYSLRMAQDEPYEKDYGIKMYDFEVVSSEAGLTNDATYTGALVTSPKYSAETSTLIDDVLANVPAGIAPLDISMDEDRIEVIYDNYVAFIKQLQIDLEAEYEAAVESGAPEEELVEIQNMIDKCDDENIPDLDEFDPIFGLDIASTSSQPALVVLKELTDDIDQTAEDFDPNDYTTGEPLIDNRDPSNPIIYAASNIANFTSTKGIVMYYGTNGYFDNPRTTYDKRGREVKWTLQDEINEAYRLAYNGTFDEAILSKNRIPLHFLIDANYADSVKETMYALLQARDDGVGHFDVGILESLGTSQIKSLVNRFYYMNDRLVSIDIQNYYIREYSTQKKRRVTMSYYIATHLPAHINNVGEHVPFTYNYAQLDGIKNSLCPMISDFNTDYKELLQKYRFNYFECTAEDVYQRAIQNTRQKMESDLLEENNMRTLYTFKRAIEAEVRGELYNFSDESIRNDFIKYINNKYSDWVGNKVQTYNFTIRTSRYEFNHSILHGYLSIVFRGLNKRAIVEIDINRREFVEEVDDEAVSV